MTVSLANRRGREKQDKWWKARLKTPCNTTVRLMVRPAASACGLHIVRVPAHPSCVFCHRSCSILRYAPDPMSSSSDVLQPSRYVVVKPMLLCPLDFAPVPEKQIVLSPSWDSSAAAADRQKC